MGGREEGGGREEREGEGAVRKGGRVGGKREGCRVPRSCGFVYLKSSENSDCTRLLESRLCQKY